MSFAMNPYLMMGMGAMDLLGAQQQRRAAQDAWTPESRTRALMQQGQGPLQAAQLAQLAEQGGPNADLVLGGFQGQFGQGAADPLSPEPRGVDAASIRALIEILGGGAAAMAGGGDGAKSGAEVPQAATAAMSAAAPFATGTSPRGNRVVDTQAWQDAGGGAMANPQAKLAGANSMLTDAGLSGAGGAASMAMMGANPLIGAGIAAGGQLLTGLMGGDAEGKQVELEKKKLKEQRQESMYGSLWRYADYFNERNKELRAMLAGMK